MKTTAGASCCPPTKGAARARACPPRAQAIQATQEHVDALKALAHLDRLRVFFHLVKAGAPVPVHEIQSALGLPGPTLSHHLESLEHADLIARTRQERFILSAVKKDTVVELVRILTACC